jgi:3-oxoacyl-[acyl-carrier-protein] synthase II
MIMKPHTPSVAITGLGAVSAYGIGVDSFYNGLLCEHPVIENIELPGMDGGARIWWSGVKDFKALDWLQDYVIDGTDVIAHWAIATAEQALSQANIELNPIRTAVVQGTSLCGADSLMRAQYEADINGPSSIPRKTMMRVLPNMGAAQIAMRHKIHGPSLTVTTACASTLDALGIAARMISSGQVDAAIVGGTEGGHNISSADAQSYSEKSYVPAMAYAPIVFGMQSAETDVKKSSRPFDANRSGIATSEGSASFVLERGDLAEQRQANILGYVAGYGSVADAFHPSAPEPSGEWEALAMKIAMDDAGISASDIDCLYAHATGTPVGDTPEIRAINQIHAGRSNPLPVTSVKGHFGHAAAASGGMSLIAGLKDLSRGHFINTAQTTDPDPEAEFDLVLGSPRKMDIQAFQVNAFGFGGQNASVVISREPL